MGQENRVEVCQSRLLKRKSSCEDRTGKRVRSRLVMENNNEWEEEFAGRAWAGHNGDIGVWMERGMDVSLGGFLQRQRMRGVGRGVAARMPGEPAGWR